ncbi:MAG: carboxypeptidase-like regulatory domain-containing protein [Terriglobales bacterium]
MFSRVALPGLLMAGVLSASAADCVPAAAIPRSCTLLKDTRAVFIGSLTEETPSYRFHVDEKIKGVTSDYFDLEPYPISGHFEIGKQYLVFVDVMPLEDGEHLFADECGPTRQLKYAQAVLEQVRAEKNGKRNAAVYGMLLRTLDLGAGVLDEDYVRPLPGVVVRFQSRGKSFEAKTDEHGAYAFEALPKGTYRVSADLPSTLEVAQSGREPSVFEVQDRSCYENDITAMPTGRITGRVIAPDGAPLRSTSVELYRADLYSEEQGGASAYQDESKPFEFAHLPPGDYVLVFNRRDQAEPDAPFSRTFYPNTPDRASAQIIHLEDGQQIMNADIHLRKVSMPTRKVTVHLQWDGGKLQDYYAPIVIVEASEGAPPYPYQISDWAYSVNLLLNAKYTVRAEAYCQMGTTGKAESDTATVDGGDSVVSELTLTLHGGECVRK